MRTSSVLALFLCVFSSAGCGDDGSTQAAIDASIDSGGDVDASTSNCFPLSGPSADLPDAIPASFTASSPTWMRPTGEECPATGLGTATVPYDTVCYVNDTGAPLDILFEVGVDGDLVPAAVIYDGDTIPTDPTQCAAVSTDLVIDVAEAYYTVPTGATITLVATLQEPGTGDFQFIITPQ